MGSFDFGMGIWEWGMRNGDLGFGNGDLGFCVARCEVEALENPKSEFQIPKCIDLRFESEVLIPKSAIKNQKCLDPKSEFVVPNSKMHRFKI